MLRRAWKPIAAATGLVGTSSYIWYAYGRALKTDTFDIGVKSRGADGKATMVPRTIPLLPKDEVERRIRQNATSQSISTSSGIAWNHTTAFLASNDPIEDANANAVIPRDLIVPGSAGELLCFAVMDGHGGPHTSRLLSRTLIPAVTLELKTLMEEPNAFTPKFSLLKTLESYIWPISSPSTPFDADPKYVSLAIQTAFSSLDSELINAPLRILAANIDQHAREKKVLPDLSQHPMALASMRPALSGSCALMALFDMAHRNLYIACTGDSRAVAGIWDETEDGKGSWRVEVLSEDQTGRNPNELLRMQSEHPSDEAANVIQNGRVLGGLEPSRAFGDARYKWPREIQEVLYRAFMAGNNQPMRNPPSTLKTAPYVTATPVVTHRTLSFPSDSNPKTSSTLRFLVLATDGLWDELSSDEVVALVGGHLAGIKGSIPKSSLPSLVPTSSGSATVNGKAQLPKKAPGNWAFVDDNISAHLIRNALGGADDRELREIVSIPAPHSRRYRDDITVTVVWLDNGREHTEDQKVRAKL